MIEVIYKEEKQEAKGNEALFSIPRNIRQIGLIGENYKIYIEDYVYTFLGRISASDKFGGKNNGCLAVLTGQSKWAQGTAYLFIRGALLVEDAEAAADHIDFSEEVWTKLSEEEETYFPGQEIVGWFFSRPQLSMEMNELFTKVHLRHFGGEKVLMLMDPVEKEEAFFRYENGFMVKQGGYYIYYEKNSEMQDYMIEKNPAITPDLTEEVEDKAVKIFRKIIRTKKEEQEPEETQERASVFSYAATACLVIAIAAVGANYYKNYQEMQAASRQVKAVSLAKVEGITETPAPLAPERAGNAAAGGNLAAGRTTAADGMLTGDSAAAMDGMLPTETDETAGKPVTDAILSTDNASTAMAEESGKAGNATKNLSDAADMQRTSGADRTDGAADASQPSKEQDVMSSSVYREEADVRKAKRRESIAENKGNAAASRETAVQDSVIAENAADATGNSMAQMQDTTGESTAYQTQDASGSDVHESYIIRPGDTLYQISIAKYGSMDAISEICRLNGLTEEQIIYPGQVIVLP